MVIERNRYAAITPMRVEPFLQFLISKMFYALWGALLYCRVLPNWTVSFYLYQYCILELRIRVKLIFKVLQTLHFIGSNEAGWLERGGSNSWPPAYQTGTLPTELRSSTCGTPMGTWTQISDLGGLCVSSYTMRAYCGVSHGIRTRTVCLEGRNATVTSVGHILGG